MYIRATGNISQQKTYGNVPFLKDVVAYESNRLSCIIPDYNRLIDPKLIRRMSRIIKMGVASAMACLQEAGIAVPDAIITGTAYGCLEDTGIFLSRMAGQKEEMLTPTSFIQSTHNTIAAQVALLLNCHGYNNTFVNGGSSFECALLDAQMILQEGQADTVLVGGIDEITEISFTILSRFGVYRKGFVSSLDLFRPGLKGTIAGEGSAFFLLTDKPAENNLAKLDGLIIIYKPVNFEYIEEQAQVFLSAQNVSINDIDVVLTGSNGDEKNDRIFVFLQNRLFKGNKIINYKHLCGEYPTSSAFALWYAANILKAGMIPNVELLRPVKKILIYNHYQFIYHSFMLLSAC